MLRELPEGWEWTKLGDISDRIHYGYTASAENKKVGPKLLRITDIQDNKVDWETVPYCPISEKDLPNYLLKSGDLVFARTGATVGKSFLIEGDIPESVFASYLIRVILKKNVNQKFVCFFFQSPHYWNQIEKQKVGAGQENVNSQKLSRIEIPLPPLSIQNEIVAVLEQAEAVKRQRQEADALTGALLQSVFYEMFGEPVRNERHFPIKPLKELCYNITDGKHGDCTNLENSGYYFISAKDIIDGKIDYSNSRQITKEDYLEVNKRLKFEIGDIIITNSGSIGKIAIADDIEKTPRTTFQKSVAIIKPNTQLVNLKYLATVLDHNKQELMKQSSGSSQKNLLLRDINEFEIPLPPLSFQQQFAHIVRDVERIRDQQVASGRQIDGLCEGLMQRAFSGELAI